MTLTRKVKSGFLWQIVEIGSRQLISLLVFATLSRLLAPEDFGLFGLVMVYQGLVNLLATQGIGTAIIQRAQLTDQHLHTAFWTRMATAAALCGATIALSGSIASFYEDTRLAPLLIASSFALVLDASSNIQNALLTKQLDFRTQALRLVLANSAGGACGISLALADYGVWALVGQFLTTSLVGSAFIWFSSPYRPKLVFSLPRLRELSAVSAAAFLVSILWLVTTRLDHATIGKFIGPASLGLYVVAWKLPDFLKQAAFQPISKISLPALSQIQNDPARTCRALYLGMRLNALVSFPIFIGIASVCELAVPLLFGEKWTDAGPTCQLVALLALIYNLQVFVHPTLVANGGLGRYLVINVVQAIGTGIASLVGVSYGLNGLLIGLIVNATLALALSSLFLKARIGISIWQYLSPAIRPAIAAVAMFFALRWLPLDDSLTPTLSLVAKVAIGSLTYALLITLIDKRSVDTARKLIFQPQP